MTRTLVLVGATLAALLILGWLVRLAEPKLAFFPFAGEGDTPAAAGVEADLFWIDTADGERLRAWHLRHPAPRAQVVYFHGNGGNLSMWLPVYSSLWRRGFSVLAFDYRGYGISTGSPSEAGLYRDTEAALAAGRARGAKAAPTIYWGRSLGTVFAAYAASRQAPDGLILEAGFPGVRDVLATNPILWAFSWLGSYRFPTAEWLSAVRVPTLVLHGDEDEVIRYSLGQRLYESVQGPKEFVTIPGAGHNDIEFPEHPYWTAIEGFADGLPRRN